MKTYYVKASEGAAEKGPFSMEVIRESLQAERLRDTSLVREESAAEWVSLRDILQTEKSQRDAKSSEAARVVERRVEGDRRRKAKNRILIGCVALGAGVLLTYMSYDAASNGGSYYVFRGLVLFGLFEVIRGLAARNAPWADERGG